MFSGDYSDVRTNQVHTEAPLILHKLHNFFCAVDAISEAYSVLLALRSTPEYKDMPYTLNFEVTFKTLFETLIKYLANEYNLNYLKIYIIPRNIRFF